MTYVLLNLVAFGGLLFFMYYVNRDSPRSKEISNELNSLREKTERLQHRVENLEAIIADKDFDAFSNSTSSSESKRQRTD